MVLLKENGTTFRLYYGKSVRDVIIFVVPKHIDVNELGISIWNICFDIITEMKISTIYIHPQINGDLDYVFSVKTSAVSKK